MKITPSALIDELYKTSGGTTIQNSYGGLQLHRKAYQKKKKSPAQQKGRSTFTNVQSSWRDLTTEEQNTWITAAPSGTSGFELYSATNNLMVNQGINIIPEYVAPITPPTSDLEIESEAYSYTPGEKEYTADLSSPGNLLPTSGWIPYIQWTGWLAPGQYRFPSKKLVIPQSNILSFTDEEIIFRLREGQGTNMSNFTIGSKALFTVNLINTTTGQIAEMLQYQGGQTPA